MLLLLLVSQPIFRAARKIVALALAILSVSLTSILGQPVHSTQTGSACTVEIMGEDSRMYPGEYVTLMAVVGDGGDASGYSWEVEGGIVKDYDDNVLGGQAVDLVDPPTMMNPSDFENQAISFYWKPESDVNRTVHVRVQTANGICEASEDFIVMMDDNINTQAEDFYVGSNHPEGISTRVLDQHNTWHRIFRFWDSTYNDNGNLFFDFHKVYLAHFDAWRDVFGYRPIGIWDPGTPFPSNAEVDHLERDAYQPTPLPSWFRIQPDGDGPNDRILGDSECETADAPTGQWPHVQDALNDFDPDLDLLGCTLTSPFHNDIHVNIGGHMGGPSTAPLDPIFWRWHNYVDGIADARISSISDVSLERAEESILQRDIDNVSSGITDTIPPRIFYQNPFRLVQNITREQLPTIPDPEAGLGNRSDLPAISILFSEPVSGVTAKDFTVNNSIATHVGGEGAGPYVFAGFTLPSTGLLNVTVAPGNIVDGNGNKFEGGTWNYKLFPVNVDSDRDGISNEVETSSLSDPGTADTDGDGMSDGFEVNNGCLNPLVDDTNIMDIAGNITDEDGPDADSDGISNIEEVDARTDPCGPLPPTTR